MENTNLTIWNDEQEIKKLFAPSLSEKEFKIFLQLGKSIGANPFTREIYAVKYKDNPASIFCGRDFYRRKAQELPEYDGHTVDAVYTKDSFKVQNSEPQHSYNLSDRGSLAGAYCTVYRKNARVPYYVFVEFSEYNTGMSVWKSKPATMIKKVAEAQGLRGAFQGTFAGTYDESEQWESKTEDVPHEELKSLPKKKKETPPDPQAIVTETPSDPSMATIKQKTELLLLLNNKLITNAEKNKMVEKMNRFTAIRCQEAIENIKNTIKEREADNYNDALARLNELKEEAFELDMSEVVDAIDQEFEQSQSFDVLTSLINRVEKAIKARKEQVQA